MWHEFIFCPVQSKGLDRIAVLLAVPMAIYGAYYSSKKYSERHGVVVYACDQDWKEAESIYYALPKEKQADSWEMLSMLCDDPKNGGVLANGEKELIKRRNESLVMDIALERAIKWGGDPSGTLVNKKTFGVDIGEKHEEVFLLPSQLKRWLAGIIGSIGFSIATVLSAGLFTRSMRWVKKGFLKEKKKASF